MATGANLQPGRGMVLSNITPEAVMRTGEGEVWDAADRVFKRFEEAGKADLLRRAEVRGAAEGARVAAGEAMPARGMLFFGDVAEARTAALQTAYTAKVRTDIDRREAELRREHQYDPEAYERAAGEMRSGFIQGAPSEFAVDVEAYANNRVSQGLQVVASARSQADEREINQSLSVRIATLDERLIALSANGQGESEEYGAAWQERAGLQDQRSGNPAILYSEDQRVADDDKLQDGVLSANVTRLAVQTYSDNGRGLAGYAAGTRFLREEVLEGEAFKDVDPERRQRIYRDGMSQLRDFTAADREERKAQEEDERARRAEEREKVGELRLGILLGEVTEAQVLGDESLSEAAKAGLVSGARAQSRRERAEERALAALETAGRAALYGGYRDQAQAGSLTNAEIADALNGGEITPGQAQTLRTLNSRTLAPLVEDVMAPVLDASRRPGASVRGDTNSIRQRAESDAARWIQANPDATLEDRLKAGRWYAERYYGSGAQTQGATGGGNGAARASRIAAVNQQIAARRAAGRPYSTAEANRMRTEAQRGN